MGIQEDSSTQQEVQIHDASEETLDIEANIDLRDVNIEFDILNTTKDPEKGLYFSIIRSAVEDYLFFGVKGKHSCDAEEFLSAYNYLFVSRSSDKSTWLTKESFDDTIVTDEQLKLACFDVHFDLASLGKVIKRPVLLTLLKSKREKCVQENYDFMVKKMNGNRRAYQLATGKGNKIANFDKSYLSKILVEPTETSVAKLFFGE